MNENTQERQEEIRKMVTRIFYMPATNGQATESIEEGVRLVEEFIADLPSPAAPAYPSDTKEMDKVINALALELPGKVWGDVNRRWQEWKKCLEYPSPEVNVEELARTVVEKLYRQYYPDEVEQFYESTDWHLLSNIYIAGYNAALTPSR